MRLVIATPLYPPEIGGPATYIKELEKGLPSHGIKDISIVKFSEVRHLPKFLRHYVYYRRVLKALRNADAVLALDPVSVGYPAHCAAKKLKKPLIVKIVGDYAWEQGRQRFGVTQELDEFVRTKQRSLFVQLLQKIQTRVAKGAVKIIVPSPYLKGIVSHWGVSEEKIVPIYNSVELPKEIPVREKEEGKFLIVSAGRRVPWKGFEAIECVAEKHPHWQVFIASGLPRIEMLAWMQAADVFVLNSTYEGLSHVLIEAMMLGTPVIATNVGGNPFLIENGKTGILIPSKDDDALEEALTNTEHDPGAAKNRAQLAQKNREVFSSSRMVELTASLLTHSL